MAFFASRGHQVTLIAPIDRPVAEGLDPRIGLARMRRYSGRVFGRLSSIGARGAIREVLGTLRPDILHVHDLTTGFGWMARASGFHPVRGHDVGVRPVPCDAPLPAVAPGRSPDPLGRRPRHDGVAGPGAGSRSRRGPTPIGSGSSSSASTPTEYRPDPGGPGAADTTRARRPHGSCSRRARSHRSTTTYRSSGRSRGWPPMSHDPDASARNADPEYLREVEDDQRGGAGLGDRLVVVPTIAHDDDARLHRLADVVVSVPLSDSISVSASSRRWPAGRPVVATDLPSPREWLADVGRGLLVPVG